MLTFRIAIAADAAVLQLLIQRAYRGEEARAGWTHEADLMQGERISIAELTALINDRSERLIVAEDGARAVGCVRVSDLHSNLAGLGLLAVEPAAQASGIGRALIAAAEQAAREIFFAKRIEMTVIDTRTELIAYYQRRGYVPGEARPFPYPAATAMAMIAMTKGLTV